MSRGVALNKIMKLPLKAEIGRMKELGDVERIRSFISEIDKNIASLEVEK
jgi:V/A-type H+-transporting ATPase subunit A